MKTRNVRRKRAGHVEVKWGKPDGWWYKELRQAEIDRQKVAEYYASNHYKRAKEVLS